MFETVSVCIRLTFSAIVSTPLSLEHSLPWLLAHGSTRFHVVEAARFQMSHAKYDLFLFIFTVCVCWLPLAKCKGWMSTWKTAVVCFFTRCTCLSSTGNFQVQCYLPSWALSNDALNSFKVSDLDPFGPCNVIVYAFFKVIDNKLASSDGKYRGESKIHVLKIFFEKEIEKRFCKDTHWSIPLFKSEIGIFS